MTRLVASLSILLAACDEPDLLRLEDAHQVSLSPLTMNDPGSSPESPDASSCQSRVIDIESPGDDAWTDPDATFTATFDYAIGPDEPWSLSLTHLGEPVPGRARLDAEGLGAEFVPDAPLEWGQSYQVRGEVCSSFRSEARVVRPEPIDPTWIDGATFGLRWSDVSINSPTNLEPVVQADFLLIQTLVVDPVSLQPVVALGTDGATVTPDCGSLTEPPTADFTSNPLMTFGPTDLELPIPNDTLILQDLVLETRFSTDPAMTDIVLTAELPLDQWTGDFPLLNCFAVTWAFGGICGPCPSTTGDCLHLEAEAPFAELVPALDLSADCLP